MRIAFIVDSFPSLSETFILNQITGLIDLGHEVEIFAGARPAEEPVHPEIEKYRLLEHTTYHNDKPNNRFVRILKAVWLFPLNLYRSPTVIFHSLDFSEYGREASSLNLFYKVISFLKKGKFDIIHCHFGPNGNLGALLVRLGIKGKLVVTFHGYDIRRGIKEGGKIYDGLFACGERFLSISEYNYKHLVAFGADPKKIITHPVGIDPERFSLIENIGNFQHQKTVRILTVSRLVKEKGLSYGLHAFNEVVKKNPEHDLEYNIIGAGPLRKELEELIKKLGLSGRVYLLGAVEQPEVIKIMRQSCIFLLPSIDEALPVGLMEAQAVGLPVVATSVGSTYQVVLDGKSGFLVPPEDTIAMAERLEYLINHSDIWKGMGLAGRTHIEENFDINKLNKRLVEIYEELIS